MTKLHWLLEANVFASDDCLRAAAELGHAVLEWEDAWTQSWEKRFGGPAIFHGCLELADRIARESPWEPGAYCRTERFCCTAWYPGAERWLLHREWEVHPAADFVRDKKGIFRRLATSDRVFVRPDSPLKPFSGRVLALDDVSLAALDHGYYFEDERIPVIVAPVCDIEREWRFVVVDHRVVTGSAYVAENRSRGDGAIPEAAWDYARDVAQKLDPPEPVYVLDVCESEGELKVIELNPFSGADLYGCDGRAIARAVAELLDCGSKDASNDDRK